MWKAGGIMPVRYLNAYEWIFCRMSSSLTLKMRLGTTLLAVFIRLAKDS